MEDNAAQPGQPVDPNDALRRLQELEAETKRLREQLQGAQSAPAVQEESQSASEVVSSEAPSEVVQGLDEEKPPQPTPEQREEADKLIQRYRLEKQRGNKDFAARYLMEAAQIAPGYTYVLECQGDEAAQNRKTEEAKRLYKLAKEQDIRNTSAETKFADLVFRSQAAPAAAHLRVQEASSNIKNAGCVSAIVPGTGQIVVGQTVKGITFLVLWAGCMFTVPTGIKSLSNLLGGKSPVEAWALIGLAGATAVYIASLVDITSYGKSQAAREKFMGIEHKVERPRPPDESGGKSFE